MRIAYVLSCFPALSETFIREELHQVRNHQIQVSVFSLKTPRMVDQSADLEITDLIRNTSYSPFFFSAVLWVENIMLLFQRPKLYGELLLMIFRHLALQPIELIKTLATFPKLVYFSSIARQMDCRHIHAHFINVPTMGAMIMSRILNIQFSCTAHGSDIYQYPPVDLKKRILAASPFVTVSNHNRDYLIRSCSLPENTVRVVHCGIDLSKFPFRVRTLTRNQKIRILTVARLEHVKGIDLLLQTCRLLLDRNVDFEWQIVGDGSRGSELKKLHNRLELGSTVKFVGAEPHARVIERYTTADLFVLTSRREGIPVSVMEAMATGLPVIVPNVTGLPELVDHDCDGVLVPPGDPHAIASAVIKLISDPCKYEELSKSSRLKISKQFNIQETTKQLVHLWQME